MKLFDNLSKYTFHNDYKNQCDLGRKEYRRRNTHLPLNAYSRYNFVLYIDFDFNSFFLKPSIGCSSHNRHLKLSRSIISNINIEEEYLLKI